LTEKKKEKEFGALVWEKCQTAGSFNVWISICCHIDEIFAESQGGDFSRYF
jgi:hypothetical protein